MRIRKVFKEGDIVKTRHGTGRVGFVDCETYSIPILEVKLLEGKHKGTVIAVTNGELNMEVF